MRFHQVDLAKSGEGASWSHFKVTTGVTLGKADVRCLGKTARNMRKTTLLLHKLRPRVKELAVFALQGIAASASHATPEANSGKA